MMDNDTSTFIYATEPRNIAFNLSATNSKPGIAMLLYPWTKDQDYNLKSLKSRAA